jgi:hypothetical protein
VRRADQVVAAQRLEPLVLMTRHRGWLVAMWPESRPIELANDLGAAGLLLVGVDLVTAGKPEGAEGRSRFTDSERVPDDHAEKVVQWVLTRDVTDICSIHRNPSCAGGSSRYGAAQFRARYVLASAAFPPEVIAERTAARRNFFSEESIATSTSVWRARQTSASTPGVA